MSAPFDWEAALGAIRKWITATLGPLAGSPAPPILLGDAGRQEYDSGLAVVLEWVGDDDSAATDSLEVDALSAAPELSPPLGDELVETTQQNWHPVLLVSVLNDPDTVMHQKAPLAVLLRLLTTLRSPKVDLAFTSAGLAFQGYVTRPKALPRINAEMYQPEASAELRFEIREQADTRIGYLTGVTLTGTINGASFPITAP